MTFGQFLAQCRTRQGLTQKELAALLFVGESAVSKWENDKRRPDLELVSKLSEIFEISEGELIKASIDKARVREKQQARNFRIINNTYKFTLYLGFAITLLVCFIVNLAVSHTLSWFFIVLSALILSSVILLLPQYIKKYRLLIIPLSWLMGLYLLLLVICIYSGGNWFFIPAMALLLAYSIIFAPLLIAFYLPIGFKKHSAVLSISADIIILILMLIVIDLYTYLHSLDAFGWSLTMGLPIVLYWAIPIFAVVLIVRYVQTNKALKASAITLIWTIMYNVFLYIFTEALNIRSDSGFFWQADLARWGDANVISANVMLIINISLMVFVTVFAVFGFYILQKSKKAR